MAIYKAASFGIEGIKPKITLSISVAQKIIQKKAITHNQSNDKASIFGSLYSKTTIKKCQNRNHYPSISGISNNKFIPIAIPKTSAEITGCNGNLSQKVKNVIDKWRISSGSLCQISLGHNSKSNSNFAITKP
jgi:hypothetical protein